MPYNPSSSILFITICSLNKAQGGKTEYVPVSTIAQGLSPSDRKVLYSTREKVRTLINEERMLKWQGVSLHDLEYNSHLAPAPDFGGADDSGQYVAALDRYEGRLYQTLGSAGKDSLFRSKHHVLIISGLYGLLTPGEPIQLYSCPLKPPVAKLWRKNHILTRLLVSYVNSARIKRIIDLTAVAPYRNLIEWDEVNKTTGADTLHCFDNMAAGDHALVPFGRLMKDYLLTAEEEDILTLPSDHAMGGIVFRSLSRTFEGFPKEETEIAIAELEVPLLEGYSVEHARDLLGGGLPLPDDFGENEAFVPEIQSSTQKNIYYDTFSPPVREDSWLLAVTSYFYKKVSTLAKNLQGRILAAVLDICREPLQVRGDTKMPLKGYEGVWRYRIGDYRLFYKPEKEKRTVYLISLGSRGDPELY